MPSPQDCRKNGNPRRGITICFYKIAPNGRRPTRIVGVPADYMEMKLWHDVADSGKVDFADGKFILYKTRRDCRFVHRQISHVFCKIEQITRWSGVRNQD